jgi:hypothetical protein
MHIVHDFNTSPEKYFFNGQDNEFPLIEKCPLYHDLMVKNGFYERYIIAPSGKTYIICIRRYRYQNCNHIIPILPDFLLPQFQRSLSFIVDCLNQYFDENDMF